MGNYIVQADLKKKISDDKLVQLTDDNKTGLIDTAIVAEAITDAEAEVDGYAATKYAVPVSPATDLIKKFSISIAVKNLYGRRPTTPQSVTDDYDNTILQLKDVAKGVITLGVDPAPKPSTKGASGETFGPERVFDRDKLGGF